MALKNKVSIHTFLYHFKFVQWRERGRERKRKSGRGKKEQMDGL